ncbi:barstar family protein [Chryseobacterium arthrosphaerae]|uniref:barstar family protein n=1 Tax=Chryseobacterium arthrosphaerae TaxID=651561 RepID=UPI001F4B6581|nr:barstar family protein [Chryseobacterium arthrosphaerae]MDG4652358.1 barstar family protein [Chryseobacterium arthrosphaerae]
MFGFGLDTGGEPEIITLIDQVNNIESSYPITYKKVRLTNVHNIPSLISAIETSSKIYENNGLIYKLDQQNTIVGSTFISNIQISKPKKNIILTGFVWTHPKGYQRALDIKAYNEITEKNIWKSFRKDELQGWLVNALHSGKFENVRENIEIQIDGNEFHNMDGFFCALGEEIHGPGGYFGKNINALYDCFRGGFGVKSISELTWINHQKSKKLFKSKFKEIIEIFEDFNVKVILS